MGATKRLAELVLQAHSLSTAVLVLRWFALGMFLVLLDLLFLSFVGRFRWWAITLTHPEIIRYFMTIPEAATLVLQSSALTHGGDVFLLDMGEPVRIKALAEQMVRLSGLSLRDVAHPDVTLRLSVLACALERSSMRSCS